MITELEELKKFVEEHSLSEFDVYHLYNQTVLSHAVDIEHEGQVISRTALKLWINDFHEEQIWNHF